MRLEYECTEEVRSALANVGRTEDILFSPDGTKLAIAGYDKHVVLVLDIEVTVGAAAPSRVLFTRALLLRSPAFANPHGLSWIDDETLVVANRFGQVPIIRVPRTNAHEMLVHPIQLIGSNAADLIHTPGSVTARKVPDDLVEVLVCNNYANTVSRHLLDGLDGLNILHSEVAFNDRLNVPDSVAQSIAGMWTAVSNHYQNAVFLYRNDGASIADRAMGFLRGVGYPHGVRFTLDDRAIVVADAGAPVVHIFSSRNGDWSGSHQPVGVVEVLDQETFERGHRNPEEGGPKGIALSPDGGLLFVTCEEEPLLIFDVRQELERAGVRLDGRLTSERKARTAGREELVRSMADARARLGAALESGERAEKALAAVNQRANDAEERARAAERRIEGLVASRSWKITAPIRFVRNLFRLG